MKCAHLLLVLATLGSLSAGVFGQNSPLLSVTSRIAAGSKRPANIPNDYVVTPFGYFHNSCVRSLAAGEKMQADGRVQHADGSVEANAMVCSYPRFNASGMPVTGNEAPTRTPEVDGWTAQGSIVAGPNASYGALYATWTVPPKPHSEDGQVLFYFPGLEDINNTQSILQPVLQYYRGQWAVANWNCCLSNITVESPLIRVKPGDLIFGAIHSNCPAGTLQCSTWDIYSVDLVSGESTILKDTPSDGQVFNWAFGGVMEPYYVVQCSDYPPNHDLKFRVQFRDENFHAVVNPNWWTSYNSTVTPQCNYGVQTSRDTVAISY